MEEFESNCIKLVGVKIFKLVNLLLSKLFVIIVKFLSILIKIMEGISEFVRRFKKEEDVELDREFWIFVFKIVD